MAGDAARSAVDLTHGLLLIDTGITDGTRRVAEEVLGEQSAGSGDPRPARARPARLIVEEFRWCDDFAKARNFALDAAARHGATWAMTLDTDERMEFPGYASREELLAALESDPKVRVWLVMEKGGRYAKERFVRVGGRRSEVGSQRSEVGGQEKPDPHPGPLPEGEGVLSDRVPSPETRSPERHGGRSLQWVGRVHEALVGAGQGEAKVLPGVLFWEVPKSAEGHRAKLTRDLAILREETRDKPDDPRWWYYLGQTLQGLARGQAHFAPQTPQNEPVPEPREAIEAFRRCASLPGWAEQAAWACYKGAECFVELKEFAAAVELCALGLARQAGSPELAWLAGWCCYQAGRLADAIAWERMAIALGNVEGCRAGEERISFRHLPGWYEGPYDVLRWVYRKQGNADLAAEADEKFQRALAERTSAESAGPHA